MFSFFPPDVSKCGEAWILEWREVQPKFQTQYYMSRLLSLHYAYHKHLSCNVKCTPFARFEYCPQLSCLSGKGQRLNVKMVIFLTHPSLLPTPQFSRFLLRKLSIIFFSYVHASLWVFDFYYIYCLLCVSGIHFLVISLEMVLQLFRSNPVRWRPFSPSSVTTCKNDRWFRCSICVCVCVRENLTDTLCPC